MFNQGNLDPLFVAALSVTMVGVGAIVASLVIAVRKRI